MAGKKKKSKNEKSILNEYPYPIVLKIKEDLIKEANILFGGSTDAILMVRKIEEVFAKYL